MPNTLIVPLVSGLVILCFSILWLLKQFGDWVRDPTNIEFPFEPLIASISSLIVLIITPNLEGKDLWVSWIIFITALIVLILVSRWRGSGDAVGLRGANNQRQ